MPFTDPDLSALATREGRALANTLRDILHDVQFDLANRDLRLPEYGGDYEIRPFPLPASDVDVPAMKQRLRHVVKTSRTPSDARYARRILNAFRLFMFGESLDRTALEDVFGEAHKSGIDEAFKLGLFVNSEGQAIRMNGLSLFSRKLPNGEVLHAFADTPPHFSTRTAHQRVYIGADSYALLGRASEQSGVNGYCVEMGSGSGIQLIAALKIHSSIIRAIGKERNRRAIHVSLFNAALNRVDEKMTVVDNDDSLQEALHGQLVSFAMMNPPFLAMPEAIDIDADEGSALDLRAIFPEAGWGGEDGLQVTKQFLETLRPLLAPESRLVIYSQFAGDDTGPTILRDYIQKIGGFVFAFEGQTQSVLTVTEAATLVARLIVAALLQKQEPRRLRIAVRKGGAEHALLSACALKIEQSYRRQGITHFHDGFAILTRRATHQLD